MIRLCICRKRARSRTPPHSPSPTGTPTQRKAKTNSNPTNGSECKINIASAANVKQIIKDSHEFLIISDDFFYDFALNETKFEAACTYYRFHYDCVSFIPKMIFNKKNV